MSLSQPEFAAEGKTIGALVYFSSASENTARFVAGCRLQDEGINVYRIRYIAVILSGVLAGFGGAAQS